MKISISEPLNKFVVYSQIIEYQLKILYKNFSMISETLL